MLLINCILFKNIENTLYLLILYASEDLEDFVYIYRFDLWFIFS